jgi:hypothetical protein
MSAEPIDPSAESAVVAHMLGRTSGLPMAHLLRALRDLHSERAIAAVDSLIAAGVLSRARDRLYPTPALARLDGLGMVCI